MHASRVPALTPHCNRLESERARDISEETIADKLVKASMRRKALSSNSPEVTKNLSRIAAASSRPLWSRALTADFWAFSAQRDAQIARRNAIPVLVKMWNLECSAALAQKLNDKASRAEYNAKRNFDTIANRTFVAKKRRAMVASRADFAAAELAAKVESKLTSAESRRAMHLDEKRTKAARQWTLVKHAIAMRVEANDAMSTSIRRSLDLADDIRKRHKDEVRHNLAFLPSLGLSPPCQAPPSLPVELILDPPQVVARAAMAAKRVEEAAARRARAAEALEARVVEGQRRADAMRAERVAAVVRRAHKVRTARP